MDRRLVQIVALAGLVALAPAMTAHADPYGDAATAAARALVARHGEAERPGSRAASPRCSARGAPRTAIPPRSAPSSKPSSCRRDRRSTRPSRGSSRPSSASTATSTRWAAICGAGLDLAIGPELPIDARLGGWDPSSHVTDDLFSTRIAFVVLLNFPRSTLAERLRDGQQWSRRQWAETRLTGRVALRVPAAAQAKLAEARAAAEAYINGYNLRAHHLLTRRRPAPVPAEAAPDQPLEPARRAEGRLRGRRRAGPPARHRRGDGRDRAADDPGRRDRQPAARLDARDRRGRGLAGQGRRAAAGAATTASTTREADVRYARWKGLFDAEREIDRHTPDFPTFIDRKFDIEREIPAAEVEQLLRAVLEAPVGGRVAAAIGARLERPLEPHDIWYAGFKPSAGISEASLDAKTRERYPTAEAFAKDLPRILTGLGFTPERAASSPTASPSNPSRGSGHALGARMRDDKAHLRTRVNADGMDYKGYNIAVHELGHNIEQVFSVTTIDHTLLQGVPNNAFTEALAFLFQQQDMALLGMPATGADRDAEAVLEAFWNAREIAGVSLVDIGAWRWLYAHPEASPAEFREAVVRHRAGGLEPVLRAAPRPARRHAAGHLLAHGQQRAVHAGLRAGAPRRVPDPRALRPAGGSTGRQRRQGVRARGADRRADAERMDAPGRRRAAQRDAARRGCGKGLRQVK